MNLPRLIDTPRLHLRDPRAGDAQAMFDSYTSDPAVLRYLCWQAHQSVAETARQISFDIHRWLKGSAWVWVLTQKGADGQPGEVFGQVELIPMSHPSDMAFYLRLGFLMAASHHGQGLMSEAVKAVLNAAFELPWIWRVDALCDVENVASAAMLARVGMAREGMARHAVVHPYVSGFPRDAWVFAATRHDISRWQDPASAADPACADQNR
jgi:ribosomal-protein-alanine N-acetyltransferase